METKSAPQASKKQQKDKDLCIVLLERNNQDLLQLKNQLSCYTCEPKTYALFEQFSGLRERIEHLFAFNLDLMASLRRSLQTVDAVTEEIKNQIREFNELKKGVTAYRQSVRNL